MNYVERKVRSAPGLSQEDALESLQSHPNYRSGTKIASMRRRGDRWVAVLQVPKTAGGFPPGGDESGPPPPKDEGGESEGPEEPDEGGPEGLDGLDGPPEAPGEEKKPGGKGGTEQEMLHVLTEILHALKGGPVGPEMGGPDDMGPGPDAMGGPPPHGGHGMPPAGPPGTGGPPMGIGAKLKPGEVPNKPGVVPLGAPAFSSTHPLYQRIAKVAGRQRHIPVSSPVGMTIKQARVELDPIAHFFGYRVAQIRYCGPRCTCQAAGSSKIHALLEAS
jgi:hypothetical protein